MATNSTGSFGTPNNALWGSQNNARGIPVNYPHGFLVKIGTDYKVPSFIYPAPPAPFDSTFLYTQFNGEQDSINGVTNAIFIPISGTYGYYQPYTQKQLCWVAGGFEMVLQSAVLLTPGIWSMNLGIQTGGANYNPIFVPNDPSNIFTIEFAGQILCTFTPSTGWVSGAGVVSGNNLFYNYPPGTPNEAIYASAYATMTFDAYALSPNQIGSLIYRSKGNSPPTYIADGASHSTTYGFTGALTTAH